MRRWRRGKRKHASRDLHGEGRGEGGEETQASRAMQELRGAHRCFLSTRAAGACQRCASVGDHTVCPLRRRRPGCSVGGRTHPFGAGRRAHRAMKAGAFSRVCLLYKATLSSWVTSGGREGRRSCRLLEGLRTGGSGYEGGRRGRRLGGQGQACGDWQQTEGKNGRRAEKRD